MGAALVPEAGVLAGGLVGVVGRVAVDVDHVAQVQRADGAGDERAQALGAAAAAVDHRVVVVHAVVGLLACTYMCGNGDTDTA